MTTNYHAAVATGAAANAATINAPLGQLDEQLTATQGEVTAARSGYGSLNARLSALTLAGGNVATLANGAASAGQKVVDVDSTTGFVAGAYVAYLLAGGALEYNRIDAVTSSTRLTLITNIGTGGIGDNAYVSMISPSEYQAANAINHAGELTLVQALAYAAGGVYNVRAYGAVADGATDDAAAINAAIAAAAAAGGGTVLLPEGTYKITAALDLTETSNIALVGGGGHFGTVLDCHNTGGAAIEIIGSKQIRLADIKIEGDASNTPAVGVWCGRGVSADTSQVVLERVYLYGAYSLACVYVTGCESVQMRQCSLFPNNAGCDYGVLYDWQNTAGLSSEHTTLSTLYTTAFSSIENSFLTCDAACTAYSPVGVIYDIGPVISHCYLAAYGAPVIYLKGGSPEYCVKIHDCGVEQTPTRLIQGDAWDGDGGTYYKSVNFRVQVDGFGGGSCSEDEAILFGDGTVLTDSRIVNCSLAKDFQADDMQRCVIGNLSWYGTAIDIVVTGYCIGCRWDLGYDDTITMSGNTWDNVINRALGSSSAGYMLINHGLQIGQRAKPGDAGLGTIRNVLRAATTWAPGAVADGATVGVSVTLSGVAQDGEWMCMASYAGLGSARWHLTAHALSGAVYVTATNRSGGELTPTGALAVTAWRVV